MLPISKMHFDRGWGEITLWVLISFSKLSSEAAGERLFLGKYPSPDDSNSPIDIETDQVNKTFYFPLILRGVTEETVKLANTGTKLEVTTELRKSASFAAGGVLGENKYIFEKINYLWTDDLNGSCATTINKKGFTLEAVAYFYKEIYGSFENSLNYYDGLAVIIFPITICTLTSTSLLTFPLFAESLKKVTEAGRTTTTYLGLAFAWFDTLVPLNKYFAYPGAYKDEKTNKTYYCQIDIVFERYLGACITKNQFFETFGSMKNSSGKPMTSTEKQQPRIQPVVETFGVLQFLT